MGVPQLQPRFIRAKDAPDYLGMCRDEFNKTVRPFVHEFPIGERGVGFDRQQLDDWATAYVLAMAIEKPGVSAQQSPRSERPKGVTPWREKPSLASPKGMASGTSIKRSTENDFMKALAQVTGRKRNAT
jgi:hypothetical protein